MRLWDKVRPVRALEGPFVLSNDQSECLVLSGAFSISWRQTAEFKTQTLANKPQSLCRVFRLKYNSDIWILVFTKNLIISFFPLQLTLVVKPKRVCDIQSSLNHRYRFIRRYFSALRPTDNILLN